jgi:DNA-directed RNA polymerase subunit RPC12/RpoP
MHEMVKSYYDEPSVLEAEQQSESKEEIECPRCGFTMKHLQVCHLRCNNCGAELTCSDKSFYW